MRNSKKAFKTITITAAMAIFGVGTVFAVKTAGSANTANDSTVNVVAAGNEVNNIVIEETKSVTVANDTDDVTTVAQTTVAATEPTTVAETKATEAATVATEAQTEATTVAQTEAAKEVQTEAATEATTVATTEAEPVVDETVAAVIALINQERAAVGLSAVKYDATLTTMAQTRASENASNNWFVVENGKHIRPDGRTASSVAVDFGQAGNFGEVMGRYQATPSEIVTGWHNSATHYACMTNSVYTRVGVGVAADAEGYLYWTAIFMN